MGTIVLTVFRRSTPILLLVIIYLSFISLGLPDSLLGAAWPSMHARLNVPLSYAPFISVLISCGTVVSSVFAFKILKRFGTGRVTCFSILLTSAVLVFFSCTHTFYLLCLCALPLGLGAGAVDSGLNNYVALHYRALHMNWLHCFWGVGASIGPLIMSAFLMRDSGAWFMGYRAVGMIQCCLFLISLAALPLWENGRPADAPGGASAAVEKTTMKDLLSLRGVKSAALIFFCYCGIEAVCGLWSSSYLVREFGIVPEEAARWTSLFYLGITCGRFVSGFLTLRLSNAKMLKLGVLLIAAGIICANMPIPSVRVVLVGAGLVIIGLGCAPIFPTMIHETPRLFGARYSQGIIGLEMAAAYVSASFCPAVFGILAQTFSFKFFFAAVSVFWLTMIFMLKKLGQLRRGSDLLNK